MNARDSTESKSRPFSRRGQYRPSPIRHDSDRQPGTASRIGLNSLKIANTKLVPNSIALSCRLSYKGRLCFCGGRSSVGRASDCDSGCRGFKPRRSPHFSCSPKSKFGVLRFFGSVLRFFGSSHFMVGVRLKSTRDRHLEASVGNFRTIYNRKPSFVQALRRY